MCFPRMDRPFEYLHGLYFKDKGKYKFKYFWANDFTKLSEEEIQSIRDSAEHYVSDIQSYLSK